MRYFRNIAFAAFAGCIGLALLPSLQADTWDKKTTLTINEPIQVPSCCTATHTVTLQPGEYVMVLVDSSSDRHIVRIFDKDQQNVITTILAIPNYRLQPTGNTVFQFWEVPEGQPKALRAWFYPGDNFGQEFAYAKQTAAQIAAFAKTQVPAIDVDTTAVEDLKTAPVVAVDESGQTSELTVATLPVRERDAAMQPTQQVETASAPVTDQTADRAAATETAPTETASAETALPHTSSALPLLGFAGLVALALFAMLEGLRAGRRRSSKV